MTVEPAQTAQTPQTILDMLLAAPSPAPHLSEIGTVTEVGDGIAIVEGLEQALSDELLHFASGVQGIVLDLEPGRFGVVLLGGSDRVTIGESVTRTQTVVSTKVGAALLGRVVDALGNPEDGKGPVRAQAERPVEAEAPKILERQAVSRPLASGIKVIDAAVPIGLGQRQLIIGDRQTGKTSLAVDTILNQRNTDVICIYCAIGQRGDAVAKVIGAVRDGGMESRTIIMATGDEDAAGLAFVAPYAALTMAEYFADQAKDVLVILDDLTHHARSYRELSLLLRRPPGREAFPGDIFYIHARLLERAGQFTKAAGGGSITVLPVVETQAENLSAYIPTNLISITDGQIYLSPRLMRKNQFPAVDLGISVSRVGGKAQTKAFRSVAGNLRVTLSQFEELEEFARFGTRLDNATRARLTRGAAVRMALHQTERDPMPAIEQLAVLVSAMAGQFDGLGEAETLKVMTKLRGEANRKLGDLAKRIADNAPLTDEDRSLLVQLGQAARESTGGTHDPKP
ncbi:F0F1 ATP synthase subunit alpha [Yoonia sediminilitoris]|uniref:ATP synthase subunit alpha n=1 Tax=Yoonia sediminilitoris TaxID=1286148 RepID=A0A2T6KJQ0_9RHOB|nr:F0F1 ATP synthase subunit alpha [Yoonia sediminilitoris]PUB16188.1 F-type H+-transporting ATPase subunit alpha [Yoonia sediminilitoris]RCW96537.1 F-type H+-transporting ATPase subunit alpha [Yoonia sediminilitoris]